MMTKNLYAASALLLLCSTTFAQSTLSTQDEGRIQLVSQTVSPRSATLDQAYELQYAVKQMGGKDVSQVTQYNGIVLADDFPDPSKIDVIKLKIDGVEKLLVKAPKNLNAGIPRGTPILIDPQNLGYIDHSIKRTYVLDEVHLQRWSDDFCSVGNPIDLDPVLSIMGQVNHSLGMVTDRGLTAKDGTTCHKGMEFFGAGWERTALPGGTNELIPSHAFISDSDLGRAKPTKEQYSVKFPVPHVNVRQIDFSNSARGD